MAYSILNGDLFENGKKGKEKKKGIKRTKCFFLYPLEKCIVFIRIESCVNLL